MLITLVALVALFFIVRFALIRYGSTTTLSTAVASIVAVAFIAGFALRAALFTAPVILPAAAPVAAVAPAAAVASDPPGKAVLPLARALTAGNVAHLAPAGKATSYSVIESTGSSGPLADHFAAGSPLQVTGWAGDPQAHTAAAGLVAIVDGKPKFDETRSYGTPRMDVARAFGTLGMLHSGFAFALPSTGLAKGAHRLELGALSKDGKHYQVITVPARAFTID